MKIFFQTIFDLSFKKFITPKIVTTVYVLASILSALSSLTLIKMPLGFIIAPIAFVVSVVFIRCGLELVLAVFQIARYSAEIARRGRSDDHQSSSDQKYTSS